MEERPIRLIGLWFSSENTNRLYKQLKLFLIISTVHQQASTVFIVKE